jgi:hypothetical protein
MEKKVKAEIEDKEKSYMSIGKCLGIEIASNRKKKDK